MKLAMGKSAVALVIRTKAVELLAIQGKNVTSRVRVPIEGTEPSHLTEAIQKALETGSLKTKRMAVAVPTPEVLVRFFTIPPVPKAEMDSVVQFEARKYIPFKIDQLVWDYRVVSPPNAKQLEVIFAAMPLELCQATVAACAAAGVQPFVIEPRSSSMARLMESKRGTPSNEFSCLVDVDQDGAHLVIAKNRLPYLTREVSFLSAAEPGTAPAEPSSVALPVAWESAPTEGADAAPGMVDARAERLLSELSVSMNFFMREYPSTRITRVVLFGDEMLIGPWCGRLSDQLRCPVELGSPWIDQQVQGGVPLSFASAVGLLGASREGGSTSLDFQKRSLAKAAAAVRATPRPELTPDGLVALLKTPEALKGLVVAGLLLAGLAFLNQLSVSAEHSALEQLARRRQELVSEFGAMTQEDLDGMKDRATAQVTLLKQIIDQRASVAAKLDALARAMPEGVWFTAVSFEGQLSGGVKDQVRLTLTGACFLGEGAKELVAIDQFEKALKLNKTFFTGFREVQVGQINAQTSSGVAEKSHTFRTFQLNCSS